MPLLVTGGVGFTNYHHRHGERLPGMNTERSIPKLSRRLLTGNVVWNLAGTGLPLLVGAWSIPLLIQGLGAERFALLTIIWMGIGYFSFFDLGIGRALTKLVSESLAVGRTAETANLIAIGLRLMFALGVIAGLLVACFSPMLIDRILRVPPGLRSEALGGILLLSATLPFVISSAGLIGILQAYQRFNVITWVRIPLGVLNFLGPVLVLPLSRSLIATTAVMTAGRIASWLIFRHACRDHQAERTPIDQQTARMHMRHLLGFGGWITVSNLVGPVMVYFDRFFVSALAGLAAVAHYATPHELISRISIIPSAVAEVIFPAFAMALAADVDRARSLFLGASTMLMALLLPLISGIVLFAPEGLNWWLGPEFSQHSTPVLRWLALGVFINSFARFPLALLQAHHRPDLTAKLHLAELPLYLVSVYVLTLHLGIVGTAMAWTLRVALDALLLFLLAGRTLPALRTAQIQVAMGIGGLAVLMGGLSTIDAIVHKVLALGLLSGAVLAGGLWMRRKAPERNIAHAHQSSASLVPTRKP